MKKKIFGLIGCFLIALTTVKAQDTGKAAADSVISLGPDPDTTAKKPAHSIISRDTTSKPPKDTTSHKDSVITIHVDTQNPDSTVKTSVQGGGIQVRTVTTPADADTTKHDPTPPDQGGADQQAKDTATAADQDQDRSHELDRRWFISPLLKLQFQDFAMLEKNRKGYLSDANNLPFFQRGNASFAASAYKNITSRLSFSADLGLSFGHVTSNNVLLSTTKSQTFNLLNASIYYHLISPAYRLQPYVTVGFNDIINNGSFPTVPLGIGAKFNSRKIMILGQITYGQSVSSSVASTTMYSMGIYIPIKSKKYKNLDQDNSPYLNKNKDDAKKKDSTNKNGNANVNVYITINMDSILRAKGLMDDNGNPLAGMGGRNGRNGGNGGNGANGNGGYGDGSDGRSRGYGDGDDDNGNDAASRTRRRKKPFKAMGLDGFDDSDYRIDSLDGKPTLHFVVYFEFNEYGLNSKAFGNIDKIISHLNNSSEFTVEIKGYTDSVGSDPYNNMLSRKRSKMVLDYMNSRGIPAELMKAKAYGKDDPVADNSDPNQAWLNRRAEIIIHRKEVAAK
jgi:outer membrane protein OmpA-like peptidoglycan-associated protein